MSRTMWMKKLIGGTANLAQAILYSPTGRAQTNVKAELDRINSDLTEFEVCSIPATGKTYLTQFQAVMTYFDNLTDRQKHNAVLVHEGKRIRFNGDAGVLFSGTFTNGVSNYLISFNPSGVILTIFNGSSASTSNVSNNNAAMDMKLITWG